MKSVAVPKLEENVVIYEPTYIHPTVQIGEGTKIGAFCDIGKNVVIGKHCVIQAHVTISNETVIGDNVFVGPSTSFFNDKYPPYGPLRAPVVKDNVVIGGHVSVGPSVTVGEWAVVCMHSNVTSDVTEQTVVKGNPARIYMTRTQYDVKARMYAVRQEYAGHYEERA